MMRSKLFSFQPWQTDLATLLLRILFGGLFVYAGYQKILNYDQYSTNFDIIGIGSKLSYSLVIFAEFFCGLLVLFGFVTRLAVIPIFITMVVAYFVAHAKDPFQAKQLALIFLVLSVVVFFLGSGKYSADKIIFKR